MKKADVDQLVAEAERFIGREVIVVINNSRGEDEEKRFVFETWKIMGFGKIQEPSESYNEEDMFYHVTTYMREIGGKALLDTLPLEVVLVAIKSNSAITYKGSL